jgi:hypothetical protein
MPPPQQIELPAHGVYPKLFRAKRPSLTAQFKQLDAAFSDGSVWVEPAATEVTQNMQERNVIVDRETGGGNGLGVAIVAIIAIAAIVAVLLWQPWNPTRSNTTIINPPSGSQTTITQPGPGSAGGTSGGMQRGTSGSSGSGTSGGSSGSNGGYSR